MIVKLKNKKGLEFDAEIFVATKPDLKLLTKDWKFNWLKLNSSNSIIYKISIENKIQGLIKLEEENDSYYVLKNIEVAPSNFGAKGEFQNTAEILMAFACLKSFELNIGNYKGYLVFTSKGTLIEYYQNKYQAELIFRERMIINPKKGKQLIKTYLKINLNNE